MHCHITLLASLAALLGTFYNGTIFAQAQEGSKPYMPTREEWIAVLFNSTYQMDEMDVHGYRIRYVCPPGEETVVIHVTHRDGVNREAMNGSVDLAKKMVMAYATSKGWQRWLKTGEKFVKVSAPQMASSSDTETLKKDDLKDVLKDVLQEVLKDLRNESKEQSP